VQAYPCSCPEVGKLGHARVAMWGCSRHVAMALCPLARYLGGEKGK
jgi:hypothetical protein